MPTDGAGRSPLGVRRAFTVAKHTDRPEENEDRWCGSPDGAICALSDGASVSFDPGPWADILVRRFVGNPEVSCAWLGDAIQDYARLHDREAMPWMQQAAFDRGSFATLLGAVCGEGRARVLAVGDSLLALVDGDHLVRTLLYEHPEAFDQRPRLLSTNLSENACLQDPEVFPSWQDLDLAELGHPAVLMMTDALGGWLLDNPGPDRVAALHGIEDQAAFEAFVQGERGQGRLKRDDTTLIVIGPTP
jgi:hypothetical protein